MMKIFCFMSGHMRSTWCVWFVVILLSNINPHFCYIWIRFSFPWFDILEIAPVTLLSGVLWIWGDITGAEIQMVGLPAHCMRLVIALVSNGPIEIPVKHQYNIRISLISSSHESGKWCEFKFLSYILNHGVDH